ncbi:FAD:protein FMN transferase [Jannaschia seohaensis]|uniref:FAD:protein FMN transferase n=1 Tax=Jannaschia seohaensis TaxID=475081 RepID=A0A2Y9AV29_9RHOB|nr:FAD:protein FMN transferase [Jannaschia seohaensis]PWJ16958.1 thiamine biosynthesis lipoprotein [Jannaschia seohaensis]SSA48210.1 thiamine biosynthesis lipoprotein [Jannaschia seohaensis]
MRQSLHGYSRRSALGLLGAALVLPGAALGAGEFSILSGRAFGTTWRLVAATRADLAPLAEAIDTLFAEIDRTFSPWRSDSVLSRFNAMPASASLRDTDLADVTAAALGIAQATDGAFDPTVGPLVARWGFGPILEGGAPDWRGVAAARGTVAKARDDLTLDLCGIAKGWALDRAVARIEALGVDAFLFELGGEFAARGRHPQGRDWTLAVATPATLSAPSPKLRLVPGRAVATSGDWEQGYSLAGRSYSHLIDPGRAAPASGALRSVTVMAGDAMAADGWATALFVAGAEAGPELARQMGHAALFLIETPDGLRRLVTGAMPEMLT